MTPSHSSNHQSCTGDHLPAAAATSLEPETTSLHQQIRVLHQQLSVLQQQLPVLHQWPPVLTTRLAAATASPAPATTFLQQQLPVLQQQLPVLLRWSPIQRLPILHQLFSPAPATRSCTSDYLPATAIIRHTLFRFLRFAIIKFGLRSNHLVLSFSSGSLSITYISKVCEMSMFIGPKTYVFTYIYIYQLFLSGV